MVLIERVREEFLKGKPVILIDDQREKEADFVFPAEVANEEVVNFFVAYGKGLFCVVGPEEQLLSRGFFKLPSNYGANYFIAIDYPDYSNSHLLNVLNTGIPARERALTCRSLSDPSTKISDFKYPGHVTLIGAKSFYERKGHSESSVELVKMAGFKPYSIIIEILDEKGDSHNLEYVYKFSQMHDLLVLSIQDVWMEYVKNNKLIAVKARAKLPTRFGKFHILSFEEVESKTLNAIDHFALVKDFEGIPLVRLHSECVTGDSLKSLRCDCGSQLEKSLELIQKNGGIILYLRQEGRGIGLDWKVKAYELQDKGLDTYEANVKLGFKPDERDYAIAAQMLKAIGIDKVRLLTNNPEKVRQLELYGIKVVERVPIYGKTTKNNIKYIRTKIKKFGHLFESKTKGGVAYENI